MPTDPSLQTARRAEILRILKQESITRQEDLVKALASRGMDATQASISRDLKELGVAKVGDRYIAPQNVRSQGNVNTLLEHGSQRGGPKAEEHVGPGADHHAASAVAHLPQIPRPSLGQMDEHARSQNAECPFKLFWGPPGLHDVDPDELPLGREVDGLKFVIPVALYGVEAYAIRGIGQWLQFAFEASFAVRRPPKGQPPDEPVCPSEEVDSS